MWAFNVGRCVVRIQLPRPSRLVELLPGRPCNLHIDSMLREGAETFVALTTATVRAATNVPRYIASTDNTGAPGCSHMSTCRTSQSMPRAGNKPLPDDV